MQQLILAVTNGNKRAFSQLVGVTPTVIENIVGTRKGKPGYELLEKIAFAIENINIDWLLTGRGSMFLNGEGPMLRVDGKPALPATPSTDITAPSDTVVLRLMEKLDEKDAKIDQLQSELRQKSEELAALKAQHSQYQDKKAHPLAIDAITEAFTSESSGDYIESFTPTIKSPSKKSSAGKI